MNKPHDNLSSTEEIKKNNLLYYDFCNTVPAWRLLAASDSTEPWVALDLSKNNKSLKNLDINDSMHPLGDYINAVLIEKAAKVGFGGWQEDRCLYQASKHFSLGEESRSVHLGVDLWFPAGTEILCPYAAKLHSFQNNDNFLDYGPTIILEHQISNEFSFFSLYGHLSTDSLVGKEVGQIFATGDKIANLGAPPENGDWPAHLHFQIILDMFSQSGDFPGVSTKDNSDFYRQLCPDPSAILKPVLTGQAI